MSLSHDDYRVRQRVERLKKTKVEVDSASGCWLWQGAKQKYGYGTINIQTRAGRSNTTAHRLFYVGLVADIPEGSTVHHKCATRSCVNPDHLQALTPQENTAESYERKSLHASLDHAEQTIEDMAEALRDAYSQDHEGESE